MTSENRQLLKAAIVEHLREISRTTRGLADNFNCDAFDLNMALNELRAEGEIVRIDGLSGGWGCHVWMINVDEGSILKSDLLNVKIEEDKISTPSPDDLSALPFQVILRALNETK